MSALIDLKYASLLSGRLDKFKVMKPNPYLAAFRCNICGDSRSNPNARKAFIYVSKKGDKLSVKCHKCGWGGTLWFYLKQYHSDLYSQYAFEEYAEFTAARKEVEPDPILEYKKPKAETSGHLKSLKRISQLSHDHPARKFVDKRQLPKPAHARLYFVKNFKQWINGLVPGKYEKIPDIDPRLVIPLIDRKGEVFAVQGRALSVKQTERYITIRFNEEQPKLFGLDKVDPNRRVYIVEGPLDSLFLPNAIALAGADCAPDVIMQYTGTTKDRLAFVFDNEPRNIHIHERMIRLMNAGYNVCVWPKHITVKDINAMITDTNMTAADIQLIIDNNLYNGLAGQLQMATWTKT